MKTQNGRGGGRGVEGLLYLDKGFNGGWAGGLVLPQKGFRAPER